MFRTILILLLLLSCRSIAQNQQKDNCAYLQKALALTEVKEWLHACRGSDSLRIIDTTAFFNACTFKTCGRTVFVSNELSFKMNLGSGYGPKNTLVLSIVKVKGDLLLGLYQPNSNALLTLKIQKYQSNNPKYFVTGSGNF